MSLPIYLNRPQLWNPVRSTPKLAENFRSSFLKSSHAFPHCCKGRLRKSGWTSPVVSMPSPNELRTSFSPLSSLISSRAPVLRGWKLKIVLWSELLDCRSESRVVRSLEAEVVSWAITYIYTYQGGQEHPSGKIVQNCEIDICGKRSYLTFARRGARSAMTTAYYANHRCVHDRLSLW